MTIKTNNEKLNALTVLSPNLRAFVKALDEKSDMIKWSRLERDGFKCADGTFFTITQTIRTAGEQIDCFKKGRKDISYDRNILLFANEYCKKTPAIEYKLLNRGTVKDSKKIVTNAWAGESYHNWGLALDLIITKLNYDTTHKYSDGELDTLNYYKMIGLIDLAKSCGLSWGGDWQTFFDIWHFEDDSYSIPNQKYWYDKNMNFSFVEEMSKSSELPAIVEKSGISFKMRSLLPLAVGLFGIRQIFKRR